MISQIIIKTTGKCNLNCHYCYYMNGLSKSFQVHLSLNSVRHLYSKFAVYMQERGVRRATFVWHGGEPTLLKKEVFASLIRVQDDYFSKETHIKNVIQTNATLIDDEWATIFKTYGIGVGTSIDGSPVSHNRNRVYHNSKGSYDDTIRGVKTLIRHGIKPGVITVIDPNVTGKEVFCHHYDLGVRAMDFNLPIITYQNFAGDAKISNYSDFMCGVFDAWLEKNDPTVKIRGLETIIKLIMGGTSTYCHTANDCSRFITMEPNGDIGVCENLRVISIHDSFDAYLTGMNINQNNFFDIEEAVSEKFNSYAYNKNGEVCGCCPVKHICNSGCPVHRYRQNTNFSNPSLFCEYYKSLINHILSRLKLEVPFIHPHTHSLSLT